jgi:hypothetical protein
MGGEERKERRVRGEERRGEQSRGEQRKGEQRRWEETVDDQKLGVVTHTSSQLLLLVVDHSSFRLLFFLHVLLACLLACLLSSDLTGSPCYMTDKTKYPAMFASGKLLQVLVEPTAL